MTNLEPNSENVPDREILTQYSVIQELSNIRKMTFYYEECEKYNEIVGFVNINPTIFGVIIKFFISIPP
jgi:hypothetical protein